MVVMIRVGRSTRRMRSLCESATIRSPSGRDRHAVRRVELRHDRRAVVAGEAGAEVVAADDRLDDVVARVDAADHVVVRVGEVDVAVVGDGDAARRVEPRLHRRPVVAGVARWPLPPMTGPVAASRSMNVPAPRPTIITTKMKRAAQAVDAQQRRRDQRRARRPATASPPCLRRAATRAIAAPHDCRRLRGAPGRRRSARDQRRDQRAGDRAARSGQRSARSPRRTSPPTSSAPPSASAATMPKLVGRRCVLIAQQRLAAAVLLDQRADVEPRPAADEHADVAIVATSLRRFRSSAPRATGAASR